MKTSTILLLVGVAAVGFYLYTRASSSSGYTLPNSGWSTGGPLQAAS